MIVESASSFGAFSSVSKDARLGLDHSRKMLSDEDIRWLDQWSPIKTIEHDDITFRIAHGFPSDFFPFGYVLEPPDAFDALRQMEHGNPPMHLCFVGHSHRVALGHSKGGSEPCFEFKHGGELVEQTYDISGAFDGSMFYIINVGTIGQPRRNAPYAFGIFDTKEKTVEIREFAYNIGEAQKAIRDAGYNDRAADRLDPNWDPYEGLYR